MNRYLIIVVNEDFGKYINVDFINIIVISRWRLKMSYIYRVYDGIVVLENVIRY